MMQYSKDIGFALIFSSKPVKNNLINSIKKAYKINLQYFSKKPDKFSVYVCDSEKEYKKYTKNYYLKWSTAITMRNDAIVIRSKEFVEKIGKWKKRDIKNIIIHEMCHLFWRNILKTWQPYWLAEGLACHIGKSFTVSKNKLEETIKKYNVDYKILDFRYIKRKMTGHFPRYPVWQAFTDFLVKEFSEDSVKKLLKSFSREGTKENYMKNFHKIFRKSERIIFNKFINKTCENILT